MLLSVRSLPHLKVRAPYMAFPALVAYKEAGGVQRTYHWIPGLKVESRIESGKPLPDPHRTLM